MYFTIKVFHELPTIIVFHVIPKNTRRCLWNILPWVWYTQHNTNKVSYSKKRSKHEKHVYKALYYQNQQNPFIKLNKISTNHILTAYFEILTKTQTLRNQGLETWNTLRKRENQYLFLKISEGLMKKMEVLWVKMVVLKEEEADKTMKQHMIRGKIEKFLKTVLDLTLFVQNKHFSRLEWVASKSLGQVTKNSYDKFV